MLSQKSSTLFDSEHILEIDTIQLWLRFCSVAYVSAFALQLRNFDGLQITPGDEEIESENKGHG